MRVCLPYQELWTVPTRSPQINVAGQFSSQPSDILFIEIVWVSCYYLLSRFYLSYSLCCAQICDVAQIAIIASDPMLKVGWDWLRGDRSGGDDTLPGHLRSMARYYRRSCSLTFRGYQKWL